MSGEELIELKFRLSDGTDIGPSKYSPGTTVGSLKEKILAQWPKGHLLSPDSLLVNFQEVSSLCMLSCVLLCRTKTVRNCKMIPLTRACVRAQFCDPSTKPSKASSIDFCVSPCVSIR